MDIIIVCHTEFGFVSDKKMIFKKSANKGVSEAVPNLVKLADKYKAKISFVVCPEVVNFFPKQIKHEIGLHVHPGWEEFRRKEFKWNVGDSYLRQHCEQFSASTVLQDYSYQDQLNMIKTGKEYLESKLNIKPKVFVAGRGSLNNDTIKALINQGFTHDCSPIANIKLKYFDWSKLKRICMPYYPSIEDYQKKGNLPILIVPASQTIIKRAIAPEGVPTYGFSWFKACFLEYYKQNVPLFHIYLHSPAMIDSYYSCIMDKFLSFISKHQDINFKFASEIKQYPDKNFKTNILSYLFAPNKQIPKAIFRKLMR